MEPVAMTANVTGYPEPVVQWFKKGEAILPANKYQVSTVVWEIFFKFPAFWIAYGILGKFM